MDLTARSLHRLTWIMAVAAAMALPTEARAQTLQFSNPLSLTLTNGARSTSAQVAVSLSTAPISFPPSLNIVSISVSSGSGWLCAATSSNTLVVTAGTACPGASILTPGQYSGFITFTVALAPSTPGS